MSKIYPQTQNRRIAAAFFALAALMFLTFCSPQFGSSATTQDSVNTPPVTGKQALPAVTEIALVPAPVLGIVVDRTMQVVDVEEGGAADKGGIKKGDVLKKINSKNVTQPNAAREAFYSINSSQKSRIVILRAGREITLEIRPAAPVGRVGQPTPTPVPPEMTYF